MAELDEGRFRAAERQGALDLTAAHRARAVRYDAAQGQVVIDLVNGATFAFPARFAQGLEEASALALAEVRVLGSGFGICWEALDVDLSVEGLLAGRFGSPRYMAERFGSAQAAE